jgi:DNA-binding GntR family transcriptional regulator
MDKLMPQGPRSAAGKRKPQTLRELAAARPTARAAIPDIIAEAIREAVATGILEQGTPLRQNEIAADFGVSSIPVREALRRLEALGFVEALPNRGFIVSRISIEEIREIFDMRVALEPMLIRLAIPRLAADDLAAARQALLDLADERDSTQWGALNWRFHSILFAPAERPRTLKILENLHVHIDRFLRLQMSLVDGQRTSRGEHLAILEACRDRDVDLAVRLLTEHVEVVGQTIVGFAARSERPRRPPSTRQQSAKQE